MFKITTIQNKQIHTHFLLCTERTGSSLLSLMLNIHQNITCPSEEPFAVFFYNKYKNKTRWTDNELLKFIDEFWLMSEKNLDLFFTTKQILFNQLQQHKDNLNYNKLCDIIYLQFFEPKPKNEIKIILDKQIKYFFYLKKLIKIYPDSKFIILVRDPRVNAIRKKNRNLNSGTNPLYLVALWNNTYKNINYLLSKNKSVLVVKYEDLVSNPENTLKTICNYLNVQYYDKLVKTEGIYETFLDIQKSKVNTDHLNYLKDFQSSLFGKINKEKISLQNDEINVDLNDKIVKLTKPLLIKFNYNSSLLSNKKNIKFTINEYWQIFRAYMYRPFLLVFYLQIPLFFKLIIKRIKQ